MSYRLSKPWHNSHWLHGVQIARVNRGFRLLLDSRTWKRHPAPFSKTQAGAARRSAKRFKLTQRINLYKENLQ